MKGSGAREVVTVEVASERLDEVTHELFDLDGVLKVNTGELEVNCDSS